MYSEQKAHFKRKYSLLFTIGCSLWLNFCTQSSILDNLDDLSGGARLFQTSQVYNGDLISSITSLHPQCAGINSVYEAANCACQANAESLENNLQTTITKKQNFRALISLTSRHFACNLQDKNGSYCDYKIRPARRLVWLNLCPSAENCSSFSQIAPNLQSFLEDKPNEAPLQFMAGFDGSMRTRENCLNFTSNNVSDNTLVWDMLNLPWPGGVAQSCQLGVPLLCIDRY